MRSGSDRPIPPTLARIAGPDRRTAISLPQPVLVERRRAGNVTINLRIAERSEKRRCMRRAERKKNESLGFERGRMVGKRSVAWYV